MQVTEIQSWVPFRSGDRLRFNSKATFRLPDCALDQHTLKGKAMAVVSITFARKGRRSIPEPTEPDLYIEEAYRLWQIKAQGK